MTIENAPPAAGAPRRPFIVRFANAIPAQPVVPLRYDPVRQVSQLMGADRWVDALAASTWLPGTCMTKVHQETTDDE